VKFCPAAPSTGIVFVRTDLPGSPRIEATVANRTETPRRTTLRSGRAGVDMVEHIMATLAGLQIDNCEVRVDRPEMPGCDGSSNPFVAALSEAGVIVQKAVRARTVIDRVIRIGDRDSWIEARPCCSAATILAYEMDYGPESPIGHQSLEMVLSPETFAEELAPSRTFLLEAEAMAMKAQGLGKRASPKDLLVFGPDGPIDNELRFPDECVRHKLLDMAGDLALAGRDLIGRFSAHRSGHRLNAEMVSAVIGAEQAEEGLKRCA